MGRARKYNIDIGEVVGDFTCVGTSTGKDNTTTFIMECNVCHRKKVVLAFTFAQGRGIHHSSCGHNLHTKNKKFNDTWCAIRTRTTNPNYEHFADYGGRGINSDAWRYFIDFYDDMYESYVEACQKYGERNVSIERMDVNGNYCKENCCWIPMSEQKGNQRKTVDFEITFPDGTTKTFRNVMKFAREFGYNDSVIYDLLNGKLKRAYGLTGKRLA